MVIKKPNGGGGELRERQVALSQIGLKTMGDLKRGGDLTLYPLYVFFLINTTEEMYDPNIWLQYRKYLGVRIKQCFSSYILEDGKKHLLFGDYNFWSF